jgi:hypothetical protein
MTEVNSQRQALQLAIRHFKRQSWEARAWAKHTICRNAIREGDRSNNTNVKKTIYFWFRLMLAQTTSTALSLEKIVPLIKEYHSSDAATS